MDGPMRWTFRRPAPSCLLFTPRRARFRSKTRNRFAARRCSTACPVSRRIVGRGLRWKRWRHASAIRFGCGVSRRFTPKSSQRSWVVLRHAHLPDIAIRIVADQLSVRFRPLVACPDDPPAIDIGFVIDPLEGIVVLQVVADEDQMFSGNRLKLLRDGFAVLDPHLRTAPRNEVRRLGWGPAAGEGRGVRDDQRTADGDREADNSRAEAGLRQIAKALDD